MKKIIFVSRFSNENEKRLLYSLIVCLFFLLSLVRRQNLKRQKNLFVRRKSFLLIEYCFEKKKIHESEKLKL